MSNNEITSEIVRDMEEFSTRILRDTEERNARFVPRPAPEIAMTVVKTDESGQITS